MSLGMGFSTGSLGIVWGWDPRELDMAGSALAKGCPGREMVVGRLVTKAEHHTFQILRNSLGMKFARR